MNHEKRLTNGALRKILEGIPLDPPVVQILAFKNVTTDQTLRYRFLLSDGMYTYQCCLMMGEICKNIDQFQRFSLVRLNRFSSNVIQTKPVVIMADVTLLVPGNEVAVRLGSPIQYNGPDTLEPSFASDPGASVYPEQSSSGSSSLTKPSSETTNDENTYQNFSGSKFNGEKRTKVEGGYVSKIRPVGGSAHSAGMLHPSQAIPIRTVTPYQQKWTIKGRVVSKSNMRTWNNAKGEGKLFSFDLQDESGAIRITAFKAEADKFYEMIQVGDVFMVSRGSIKPANKQFSKLDHDYEISLNQDTLIEPASDDDGCPEIEYNFVTIAEIESLPAESLVDVAGVICSAGELQTITTKQNNRELKKRDLQIVDRSNAQVRVTIWGQEAADFEMQDNRVLVGRQVKVSDYGGRSLSSTGSTTILYDPDMEVAFLLKGWYDRCKGTLDARNLSAGGGPAGAGRSNAPFGLFEQITEGNISEGKDQLTVNGTIVQIGKPLAYKGCPECKKKLTDMNNGFYNCDKCQKEIATFAYRVILNVQASDHTGLAWVALFHEQLEEMLQVNFNDGICNENRADELNSVIACLNYKRFTMLIKSRIGAYQDKTRLNNTCAYIAKHNPLEHGHRLLTQLKARQSL